MANREALRELHSRLAHRLQAARSGDVAASWLAVVSGGRNYLFPLAQAGEIFPWTPCLSVPYAQPWFMGVTNLRGGLFGVVDMDRFVAGFAPSSPRAPVTDLARAESRLVTFSPVLETNCVLLIDRLAGLRHVEAFTASRAAPDDAPAFFGTIYTESVELGGAHWQEINLQALSRQSQFLSISA
jgi:twitching motility protein PilI